MVGTMDIGIKPVAMRIWTAKPCKVVVSGKVSSKPHLIAEFNIDVGAQNVQGILKINVSKDLAVIVSEILIGRIED
jgi:hypothetical protein